MSTPSSPPPDSADPDDLKRVLGAFEERTEVVEALATEVTSLVGEVRGLRAAVAHRPPRREIERKRRLMGLAVAAWSVMLILAHDQHVEACGSGVEAKAVIERYSTDPAPTREEIIAAAKDATPDYCTYLFPIHTHDDDAEWPNHRAVVGILGYAVLFGGALTWATRPSRRTREEESAEVEASTKARDIDR